MNMCSLCVCAYLNKKGKLTTIVTDELFQFYSNCKCEKYTAKTCVFLCDQVNQKNQFSSVKVIIPSCKQHASNYMQD